MSVQERDELGIVTLPPEPAVPPASGRTEAQREKVFRRRVGRRVRRAWRRRALNAFIIWHLCAVALWLLPYQAVIVQSLVPVIKPYMMWTGFMQSWTMFSPIPDCLDVYAEARITYADGTKVTWGYPRMAKMGYAQRYERERFRKWVENATHVNNPVTDQVVWTAMARYAARVNDTDPHDPPVKVELWRHARAIPPPGTPIPPYAIQPFTTADLRTGKQTPFVLTITPKDLQGDRR